MFRIKIDRLGQKFDCTLRKRPLSPRTYWSSSALGAASMNQTYQGVGA
jgi:hypothetical protein